MDLTLKTIKEIPSKFFGFDDVLVKINLTYDAYEYGAYFPDSKIIELNVLDECDKILDRDLLVKVVCHELAHHIQFLNYQPKVGKEHDEKFDILLWQLLGIYYEGDIPQKVIEEVLLDKEGVELLYG